MYIKNFKATLFKKSSKMETNQMYSNIRMDTFQYIHSGILCSIFIKYNAIQ